MISSTTNQKVKYMVRLKKSSRLRRQEGCFLVEGPRMFFEVPEDRVLACYVTENFRERHERELEDRSYEIVSDAVCRHMADTDTPQGVIALVRRTTVTEDELLGRENSPCFFLLERIQDPGNLGTILRSAEAAGITGVFVTEDTVDLYNPKTVRATMGAIFRVPVAVTGDLSGLLRKLSARHVTVYAAHLKGEVFYQYDYRSACAFLIGNEGNGLTEQAAAQADRRIRIPMCGQVESLNAAAASTVLMYEVLRQRSTGSKGL